MLPQSHPHFIAAEHDDMRLDRYLKILYPHVPHGFWHKRLRDLAPRINGEKALLDTRIHQHDVLTWRREPHINDVDLSQRAEPSHLVKKATSERIARCFQSLIVHEDEGLIVINKPKGLPCQGGRKKSAHSSHALKNIKDAVDIWANVWANVYQRAPLKLVHRLDQETSGLMVLATSRLHAARLSTLLQEHKWDKTYYALVWNHFTTPQGVWKEALFNAEKNVYQTAETAYSVVAQSVSSAAFPTTLIRCMPQTGRKHQIRRHALYDHHGLVGDKRYYNNAPGHHSLLQDLRQNLRTCTNDVDKGFNGDVDTFWLHAAKLRIENLRISAPLPEDFMQVLKVCGIHFTQR